MLNRLKIKSDFTRNVATLFMGTAIAQAIPVLFSPVFTRIYEPEQYGIFALFFTITNVCGVIATGRYEMAIILPKEEEDADRLQRLCYLIAFTLAGLLLLLVVVFEDFFVDYLSIGGFGPWLYVIPLQVFLMGVVQAISARMNRQKKFRQMSTLKITQNGSNVIIALLLGISKISNGLVIGHIGGFAVAALLFIRRIGTRTTDSFRTMWRLAVRYHHFILYNAPTALLNTVASSMPLFFISGIAPKAEVGFYGLVERVINAPIGLVSYAVSQVLMEDVATRHREGRPVTPVLYQLLRNLFLVGVVPFTALFFFAEEIFAFVFGAEWERAGEYASILSIAFFMRFLVSPLSVTFISLNKLKPLTFWQVLYFCTTLGIVLFSMGQGHISQFLVLLVINDSVMYSLYLFLILRAARNQ